MASITLDAVWKRHPGGAAPAVADVSLAIGDGERLAIVGPSGSGKSTLLRIIAGLETPSSGRVRIDGVDVTDVPPEARDLAMVFQSYALYPHLRVRENLAFPLRMRGMAPAAISARVATVAAALGLTDLLDRRPAALSGGERQRVALGRAMVRDPRAFLFDEPLSNLDPRRRADARAGLVALHARLGATMVYVTHDQEEAMTLGQRVAVLRDGRLEQVASPQRLYDEPVNRFVATFIGSPPMNVLEGTSAAGVVARWTGRALDAGAALGVRPHDLVLGPARPDAATGTVDLVEPLGHATIVHVTTAEGARLVAVVSGAGVARGDTVSLDAPVERQHWFEGGGRRLDG